MKHTSILQFTASLIALALSGATTFALGPVEDIKTGGATLVLDNSFVTGLGLGLTTFTKVAPASFKASKNTLTLPITGGVFELGLAEADIITGGGFTLRKGDFHVTFTDLIVTFPDDHTKAEVSALLTNNTAYIGRIPLGTFDSALLNIPVPVSLPQNKRLTIINIPLKLSTNAATVLNNGLNVGSVFNAGDPVGQIKVTFKVAGKALSQ